MSLPIPTIANSQVRRSPRERSNAEWRYVKVDNEGSAQGDNQTTQTIQRAGIGTAIGAVIGAIAGGGKGAVIGAVVGVWSLAANTALRMTCVGLNRGR